MAAGKEGGGGLGRAGRAVVPANHDGANRQEASRRADGRGGPGSKGGGDLRRGILEGMGGRLSLEINWRPEAELHSSFPAQLYSHVFSPVIVKSGPVASIAFPLSSPRRDLTYLR